MGEGSQMEGSKGPKWRGQRVPNGGEGGSTGGPVFVGLGVPCSWDWGSRVRGTGGPVFVGLGVPCSWDWGSRVRGTTPETVFFTLFIKFEIHTINNYEI